MFFYDFRVFGGIRSTWGKHPSKNTYGNSFLKLTPMVHRKTAPTGPEENMELPKYFLKLHEVCGTDEGGQTGSLWYG